jgi:hypothetical protein
MTALAAAHGTNQVGDLPRLTNGVSAGLLGAAGLAAAAAIIAGCSLHRPGQAPPKPDLGPEELVEAGAP